MKIGYPCINWTIGCKADSTFRLKSYSEQRLKETVSNNLSCLSKILNFNVGKSLLFFRVTSDLIPFASHPVCKFKWQDHFKDTLETIGNYVKRHNIRISMHPDQFTLINSLGKKVFENSVKELAYHTQVLDSMELSSSAKIQIHVGGVYGDKGNSIKRFIKRFGRLDETIQRRIVVENDDVSYNLQDCLEISAETEIPVLFDVFHHELNNSRETIKECFNMFTKTWRRKDGPPMVDYSTHRRGESSRKHAESIDSKHFADFLEVTKPYDFDIMLEVKDKEESAIEAVRIASRDSRIRAKPT